MESRASNDNMDEEETRSDKEARSDDETGNQMSDSGAEQDPDAQERREFESLRWILEKENVTPFGPQILRKAVQMYTPELDKVVELLLKYNTYAIDDQTINLAASDTGHGNIILQMFRHYDESLPIDDELLLSCRSPSLLYSPTTCNSEQPSINSDVYELEEESRPTWDSQACPTCHNLRPSRRLFDPDQVVKTFCWDELLWTSKAGCKFCAVLLQGLCNFLRAEPRGSQRMKMFSIDQGPLQVHAYGHSFPGEDVEFYIHQSLWALSCAPVPMRFHSK